MQFVVGKFALDDCLEGLYNSKQIESLLYLTRSNICSCYLLL